MRHPKLSLTLRSPRQRTATAGMHLGLASPRVSIPPRADAPNRFIAKCAAAVHAATSAAVTNHGLSTAEVSAAGRHLVCRQRHRRASLHLELLSVAVEKERRLASAAHERRDGGGAPHPGPRARRLTRVAAGSIEQAPRTAAARAAVAAATGAAPPTPPPSAPFTFRPTVLTKQPAKNALVKTKTGDAERIPPPGVAALTAPEDEKRGEQSGAGGAFARLFGGEKKAEPAQEVKAAQAVTVALHHGVDEKGHWRKRLDVAIGEVHCSHAASFWSAYVQFCAPSVEVLQLSMNRNVHLWRKWPLLAKECDLVLTDRWMLLSKYQLKLFRYSAILLDAGGMHELAMSIGGVAARLPHPRAPPPFTRSRCESRSHRFAHALRGGRGPRGRRGALRPPPPLGGPQRAHVRRTSRAREAALRVRVPRPDPLSLAVPGLNPLRRAEARALVVGVVCRAAAPCTTPGEGGAARGGAADAAAAH